MTANLAVQMFGDTTYTKVFVGGLAWETNKETMKQYFEQFGEILEAAVITEKNTGRSKGYGFVTFREADAATRACVDPSPVIDGRRANCNLASLGIQRPNPTTPQHGGSKSFKVRKSFQGGLQGGVTTAFPSTATFPHYAIHQSIPYNVYSYSPYSPDYHYPTWQAYYNLYGGPAAQYPLYGGTDITNEMLNGANNAFYQYSQFGIAQTGYVVQYPHLFHHSAAISSTAGVTGFALQQYGITPLPLAPSLPLPQIAASPPTPATKHYKLIIPSPFSTATASSSNPWTNHG